MTSPLLALLILPAVCGYVRTLDGRDAIPRIVFLAVQAACVSFLLYPMPSPLAFPFSGLLWGVVLPFLAVLLLNQSGYDLPAVMDGVFRRHANGIQWLRRLSVKILPADYVREAVPNERSHLRGALLFSARYLLCAVPLFALLAWRFDALTALLVWPLSALPGLFYWFVYYARDPASFRRNAPAEFMTAALFVFLAAVIATPYKQRVSFPFEYAPDGHNMFFIETPLE